MNFKIYDKIRALAGNYEMKHNDYFWNKVIRNGEIIRGVAYEEEHDYSQDYFTIESLEDNCGIIQRIWTSSTDVAYPNSVMGTLYYSTNKTNWTSLSIKKQTSTDWQVTLNKGDKIYLKANRPHWSFYLYNVARYTNIRLASSGNIKVSGNIMSLLFGDNFSDKLSFETYDDGTFIGRGIGSIFSFNKDLETIYNTKLIDAKNLCLPATGLIDYCYAKMFYGCTSLTTAPGLPATTLANGCYDRMFSGCTSLTTAPELHATTLAAYCYYYMFFECSNLNYITCLATDISAYGCTTNWGYGVAAEGIFVKNALMTDWSTGISGIPSGWTVENAS